MAESASAFIGTPPNNQRDFNIVSGWYRRFGMYNADPAMGFVFVARRPDDYTPESKAPGILGAMAAVIVAIVVPTIARLIARSRGQHTRFGSDDWAIAVAASVAVTYPILQILAVVKGKGGQHTWEATYDDYQHLALYLAASKHVYYVAVGLIKISIALFVRRIADGASRLWIILADVFIGSVAAYIIAALFWNIFYCNPPRAAWDMEYGGTLAQPVRCGDGLLGTKILSTVHVVQAALLLLTPIVILWKVRMDLAKKLRLFFIWAAGGLAVTGGLLQHLTTVVVTDDIFYQYSGILVWTSVDLCMGTLTASLPVLDAAIMGSFRAVKSKLGSSGQRTHALVSEPTGDRLTHGSQSRGAGKKEYSESIEGIMGKDEGTEMVIMRTDEVRLDYESADTGSPDRHSTRR